MAWAELVLQYVRVLVWPLTTVAIVLLFKQQARNLIDGISEFTGPANVSFKRRIAEVKERAEEANADDAGSGESAKGQAGGPRTTTTVLETYLNMVEDDPEGAITGAWRAVRSRVRDTTRELGTDRTLPRGVYTSAHVRSLVPLGLPEQMVGVARELAHLQSDVTKGRRIRTDSDTALGYVAAAEELLSAIDRVRADAASRGDSRAG